MKTFPKIPGLRTSLLLAQMISVTALAIQALKPLTRVVEGNRNTNFDGLPHFGTYRVGDLALHTDSRSLDLIYAWQ